MKDIIVYVARHGTTELNQKNEFRGNIDCSLDKKGMQDARVLSKYFGGIDLSVIVSSDKKRTKQTTEQIKKNQPDDITVIYNENLRPWNVGEFGGLPKNVENKEKLKYYVDHPDVNIPGGESLNAFRSRIRPLLVQAAKYGKRSPKPLLLVVHSSVIHEVGATFGPHHEAAHVKPGGVAAIYVNNGDVSVEPIFKPDEKATTQNVLGSVSGQSADTVS